jgi:glycopeptide antibiotics resistance protein
VFATYLSAVYLFVGMPTLQFMRFDVSLTLVPFLPMVDDIKNTILNIFLFVPLGVILPFLWKKYNSAKAVLLFGFFLSLSIELLQILTYRATDINDILANTLGSVLGYFLFSIIA